MTLTLTCGNMASNCSITPPTPPHDGHGSRIVYRLITPRESGVSLSAYHSKSLTSVSFARDWAPAFRYVNLRVDGAATEPAGDACPGKVGKVPPFLPRSRASPPRREGATILATQPSEPQRMHFNTTSEGLRSQRLTDRTRDVESSRGDQSAAATRATSARQSTLSRHAARSERPPSSSTSSIFAARHAATAPPGAYIPSGHSTRSPVFAITRTASYAAYRSRLASRYASTLSGLPNAYGRRERFGFLGRWFTSASSTPSTPRHRSAGRESHQLFTVARYAAHKSDSIPGSRLSFNRDFRQ